MTLLFRWTHRPSKTIRNVPIRRRYRPEFDLLEDRLAPSATITSTPSAITVVFSTAAETATLNVSGGSYQITDAAGINAASTGGTILGNTFTANNAAAGQTTLTLGAGAAGTLQLAAANVIPGTTSVAINAGTFDLNGYSDAIGALTGSGTVTNKTPGTYQIDNGSIIAGFNNTLGTETTPNKAEDNWVGNVFTAVAGATTLDSISFQTLFSDLNSSDLPSPFVTAALYTGAPGAGLTLVPGSVHTVALNSTAGQLVTVPFAAPQTVSVGQVFTAALLIDDVPGTVHPFALDSSNNSTNSYYDVDSPVGNVNTYLLAAPNAPTLNGATYPGQPAGASNTGGIAGVTLLRVNEVVTPAATLTVTNGGSFSGVIQDGSGQTALTLSGGNLTLSGNSTFSGATTITAGTLVIDGNNSSSPVDVTGGTLAGTGTVQSITATGGTLSPAGSGTIGTLTTAVGVFNTTLSGATYQVDVNRPATSDQLVIGTGGTINLNGGTLSVNVLGSAAGNVYTIISTASGGISGTFTGLANGTDFQADGRTFRIAYTPDSVTLTDVVVATSLKFVQQPSSSVLDAVLAPPITVEVLDQNGNLMTTDNGRSILVVLGPDPDSDFFILGILSVADVNGVATFSNLSIIQLGLGYTLTANSAGLTKTTSNPFNITLTSTSSQTSTGGTANQFFAVGATAGGAPQVNVYNAATNALVASFDAFAPSFTGGVRVAVDVINGSEDIICAAGPGGGPQVTIYNGNLLASGTAASAAIVANFDAFAPSFSGGVFIAAGTSSSGENWIAAGAGAGGGPQVVIWTTQTILAGAAFGTAPTPLTSFDAFAPSFRGGVTVALGDVLGTGNLDVIAGAGPGGGPQVAIFDGVTAQLIRSFFALAPTFTGGVFVAAGDVNGDGFADVIVGAGPGGGPQVAIFSGNGGTLLASFYAANPQSSDVLTLNANAGAGVRVGTTTVNSQVEILTAPGPGPQPVVNAFSGETLALLDSFFAFDPSFRGGVFVGG